MEFSTIKHYLRPEGRGIKLHLGCGDYWLDGYINIDIDVYGGTDMLWDIRNGLPFQESVVEIIEAYELLEHFDMFEVNKVLDDWKRVLINGGKIRISTPDMDVLMEEYPTNKAKVIEDMYGCGGPQTHKYIYTQETLKTLFEKHDFKEVKIEKGVLPERPTEAKLILECQK